MLPPSLPSLGPASSRPSTDSHPACSLLCAGPLCISQSWDFCPPTPPSSRPWTGSCKDCWDRGIYPQLTTSPALKFWPTAMPPFWTSSLQPTHPTLVHPFFPSLPCIPKCTSGSTPNPVTISMSETLWSQRSLYLFIPCVLSDPLVPVPSPLSSQMATIMGQTTASYDVPSGFLPLTPSSPPPLPGCTRVLKWPMNVSLGFLSLPTASCLGLA